MKENSKKVPDAPDILFVCPFHTGLTSGLLDEDGNPHEGYPVWHGMAVRASADNLLYINISKVWHSGKELPESNNEEYYANILDGITRCSSRQKRCLIKSRLPTFGVKDYRASAPVTA